MTQRETQATKMKKSIPICSQLPRGLARRLGKVADQELAEEFGLGVECILRERALRGIPDVSRLDWGKEQTALLGTASDEDVARQLGLTKTAVFNQRKRRGIAPFGESKE